MHGSEQKGSNRTTSLKLHGFSSFPKICFIFCYSFVLYFPHCWLKPCMQSCRVPTVQLMGCKAAASCTREHAGTAEAFLQDLSFPSLTCSPASTTLLLAGNPGPAVPPAPFAGARVQLPPVPLPRPRGVIASFWCTARILQESCCTFQTFCSFR